MKKVTILLTIIFVYLNLNISTYANNYLKVNIDKFANNKNIDDEIWSEDNKYFDKLMYFSEKTWDINNKSLINIYKNILSLDREKYKKDIKFIDMLEYETIQMLIGRKANIDLSENKMWNIYKHPKYNFSFMHKKYYFNNNIEKVIIEDWSNIYIPSSYEAYKNYKNNTKGYIKSYHWIKFEIYENIKNRKDIENKLSEITWGICKELWKFSYLNSKNMYYIHSDFKWNLSEKWCNYDISWYYFENENIFIIPKVDIFNNHWTNYLEKHIIINTLKG